MWAEGGEARSRAGSLEHPGNDGTRRPGVERSAGARPGRLSSIRPLQSSIARPSRMESLAFSRTLPGPARHHGALDLHHRERASANLERKTPRPIDPTNRTRRAILSAARALEFLQIENSYRETSEDPSALRGVQLDTI